MSRITYILRLVLIGMSATLVGATAIAMESDRAMAQYLHTAWTAKEGVPRDIRAITQTADGSLWLASTRGLFRFDGLKFESYEPQSGPALPKGAARSFLALPNGDLWIGFFSGAITHLQNGQTTNYTQREGVPEGKVCCLAQDREGTLWAATNTGLARLEGNRWHEVGNGWNFPGQSASALFVDRNGTLWVATESMLLFLPEGARKFQSTSIHVGQVSQITEAPNGKLWMAETTRSVRPIPLGSKLPPIDATELAAGAQDILFARDGDLWMPTLGNGIARAPAPEKLKGTPSPRSGEVETFKATDGLSDDASQCVFQDRDGNIWVGTSTGLDRFRKSILALPELPSKWRDPILVSGKAEDVWAFLNDRVYHIEKTRTDEVTNPAGTVDTAFRDSAGVLWWISINGLVRFENGKTHQYPLPKELGKPFVYLIHAAQDRTGTLWIAAEHQGLFRREQGKWSRFDTPPEVAKLTPTTAFTDGQGRVWFGYVGGTIITLDGGKLQNLSATIGTPVGNVWAIEGRNGHIWIGGDSGVILLSNGTPRSLHLAGQPKLGGFSGIEELVDGSLWLCSSLGILQVKADEVRRFLESPSYPVHYRFFDSLDGLPGNFQNLGQKFVQGSDGRLWFGPNRGIAWMDPAIVSTNTSPPVSIRSVTADGTRFLSLSNPILPPLTRSLTIGYSALNLSIPERVAIRYRLDGSDKDWQEDDGRREAFYMNLGPGHYRFHVNARNRGGEWNPADAVLEFSIAPAWFQTIWFRACCICALLLLLWMIYQLRLRQLERQFNMTLEARLDERTRIARELHDTLLQSFQGITLHFQRARNLLPDRADEAIETLDTALDGAEDAIVEGRDAILDLRTPTTNAKTLAEEIAALGEELVAKDADSIEPPKFRIVVEGSACSIRANLHVEILRIVREAVRNGFSHSEAHLIETELAYTESLFRLRIRDDGKGIDPDERIRAERSGHWGLKGMRERAERLGGELEVWSEPGAGTEIELRIPASIAYEPVLTHDSFWRFWRRKRNP